MWRKSAQSGTHLHILVRELPALHCFFSFALWSAEAAGWGQSSLWSMAALWSMVPLWSMAARTKFRVRTFGPSLLEASIVISSLDNVLLIP